MSERDALRQYDKETLITLYLSVKKKADAYDKLKDAALTNELTQEWLP